MAEEKSLFDQATVTEEVGKPVEAPADAEDEEVSISVQDESPADRLKRLGQKKEADGRVLTIKGYGFTKPKTRDAEGNVIPPKETSKDKKKFYSGKLVLKFEEDNLVEYYPNYHYFVDDKGKVNYTAKINRGGENAVAELFKLAVKQMGKPADEVSDKEFYEYLVGKKVKIKTDKGKFNGKEWFRNDIVEIL